MNISYFGDNYLRTLCDYMYFGKKKQQHYYNMSNILYPKCKSLHRKNALLLFRLLLFFRLIQKPEVSSSELPEILVDESDNGIPATIT